MESIYPVHCWNISKHSFSSKAKVTSGSKATNFGLKIDAKTKKDATLLYRICFRHSNALDASTSAEQHILHQ